MTTPSHTATNMAIYLASEEERPAQHQNDEVLRIL
jgi:hypothetical protein